MTAVVNAAEVAPAVAPPTIAPNKPPSTAEPAAPPASPATKPTPISPTVCKGDAPASRALMPTLVAVANATNMPNAAQPAPAETAQIATATTETPIVSAVSSQP